MRMRKKKNLIPRMERCSSVWIRTPEDYKNNWRSLMPDCTELRLELGCGKGRFTCETAALHRDKLFVAVERVPDAMVIAMERAVSMGLTNVFFIDGDAAVLSDYFAPDEVDLIYINFCDPWPGNKHVRRRLTHPEMLRGYRAVLRDGGQIHFKTDNRNLYEWSLFQFPKAGFELSEVTRDLHGNGICGVMTDYEEKFHLQGIPINRCVGTKIELPQISLSEDLEERLPEFEIRPIQEADFDSVINMQKADQEFFVRTRGELPTVETLQTAISQLPPRTKADQKHDVGIWQNGMLVAVLDYVDGYPGEGFVWIGFFMVAQESRKKGIGREVISAFLAAANAAENKAVRLGCNVENIDGHVFWEQMGFRDLRLGCDLNHPERDVMVMEVRFGSVQDDCE